MVYEHDNEYIPLRIILKDAISYYSVYNDEPYGKLSDIFEDIHEKLKITFDDFTFLRNDGEEHFNTKVSNETYFKEDIKATVILKEGKAIFTPK